METKDYYKILGLEPSANLHEIKKAYRKLAQHFHPDKNSSDQYAGILFAEIKEAYEVLTNPARKENYLQQRWYQQSLGKTKFRDEPVTPPVILKQFLKLDQYVTTLDGYRMNQESLYRQLKDMLSNDTIEQLKKFNEQEINHEIIKSVLRIAKFLRQGQLEDIVPSLVELSNQSTTIVQEIDATVKRYRRKNWWEQYKHGIILLLAVVISLLIYFASR
jgi:molecular chaperone DnaJ